MLMEDKSAKKEEVNLVTELSKTLEKAGYKIVELKFTDRDVMEESFNGKPFVKLTLAKI